MKAQCIPTPEKSCTTDQNNTLLEFHKQFITDVAAVTHEKPQNGVYIDGCYVHEQNVSKCVKYIRKIMFIPDSIKIEF